MGFRASAIEGSRFYLGLLAISLEILRAHCGTNAVGLKFLEENKGREGVVTLKSGLQYKVHGNLREEQFAPSPMFHKHCLT